MRKRGSAAVRWTDVVVWTAWLAMLVSLWWFWRPVSSRIPMAEDWYTVPFVAGEGRDLAGWLWEQNNEHRMPVARLLLLAVLIPLRGDYRGADLLNMSLLAAGAAGLILFARRLRGGRTSLADAFFPLSLLNFGHSVDVLFPFQITFVLSLAWIMLAGCPLFLRQSVTTARAAAIGGVALLLLPLSGFIGMVFVPALAACYGFAGVSAWRRRAGWTASPAVAGWLIAVSVMSIALAGLYFVGYEHPTWNPPNPGILPSLKVVLKMFALGFGPAPMFWWTPGVLAAVVLLLSASGAATARLVTAAKDRDERSAGAVVFFLTAMFFAAAVGWGRAGYVPDIGLPLRYVSIALPTFIAAYLLCATTTVRVLQFVPGMMAIAMLLLLPINTRGGFEFFANWYGSGMRALEADIHGGMPMAELARTHQPFLVHWWTPAELERHMRMLQRAGVAPFDRVRNGD